MNTKIYRRAASILLPLAVLAATGCSSTPPPVADLSRAQALVSQAEQSDAPRYASADLAAAQEKLQQANQDAKNQPLLAGRLAQESSADAELALARTRANKEQDALNQVNSSLQALRAQTQQAPAPQAPTQPPN